MRLAYKAWRESQVRFFVSAAALVWFCSLFVTLRSGVRQALAEPFAEFVSDDIYGGGIRNLYVVFIVVLDEQRRRRAPVSARRGAPRVNHAGS
jgi:hypothetical protein